MEYWRQTRYTHCLLLIIIHMHLNHLYFTIPRVQEMGYKTLLLLFFSPSLPGTGGMVVISRWLNKDLQRSQDKKQGRVVVGKEPLCKKHPEWHVQDWLTSGWSGVWEGVTVKLILQAGSGMASCSAGSAPWAALPQPLCRPSWTGRTRSFSLGKYFILT